MDLTQNGNAIVALVAAIFGGAGLRVIDWLSSRSNARTDLAKQIRDELRTEVNSLRDELNEMRDDLRESQKTTDFWREKYYNLLGGESDAIKRVLATLEEIKNKQE